MDRGAGGGEVERRRRSPRRPAASSARSPRRSPASPPRHARPSHRRAAPHAVHLYGDIDVVRRRSSTSMYSPNDSQFQASPRAGRRPGCPRPLHQADQPVMVAGAHRGEADAAIAGQDRGHAMDRGGHEPAVPGGPAARVVGVDVHEARRHQQALGVDLLGDFEPPTLPTAAMRPPRWPHRPRRASRRRRQPPSRRGSPGRTRSMDAPKLLACGPATGDEKGGPSLRGCPRPAPTLLKLRISTPWPSCEPPAPSPIWRHERKSTERSHLRRA